MLAERELIQPAQEGRRLEIFIAAVHIGNPFTRLAAVVEIEHRGDGIDAQTVDMELLQPIERAAEQKIRHLAPAVIVNQRIPVLVEALARVGVFIEVGPVELRQAMRVIGEMAGNPVEDDADPVAMKAVDEGAQIIRRPEPRRRSI